MHLKTLKNFIKLLPIKQVYVFNDEFVLVVNSKYLNIVLLFLKYHINSQYSILSCISGVDYLNKSYRFELNYELLSVVFNSRLRIKILLNELIPVNSCSNIYVSASWYECEIWDMYGIFFFFNKNLKRILTDYGFEGNPLRKDFPLSGFIEVKYSETQKRIVSESIELAQEYRTFNFSSPWLK